MDALDLINVIVHAGISLIEMAHATLEEAKPGSTEIQDYNVELAEGDTASALASPAIKYRSIAGSPCAAVRAIRAGVTNTSYVRT